MGKRQGIMLFYPFEEKRLLKWNPPYIVQPKLDGERCRAVYDDIFGWTLISSEMNVFQQLPHINQALLFSNVPTDIELDGELYCHGMDFDEISSIVSRTVNRHPNYMAINYSIFDIVEETLPQWRRLQILKGLSEHFYPGLYMLPMYMAENLDQILKAYDSILDEGYEGIIVRHLDAVYLRRRSIYGMKFKPKKSDTYRIVGYKQMVDKEGNKKEMLGALICQANDGEATFSVGSGMDDAFRQKYWPEEKAQELVGHSLFVEYQHITSGMGVPRFPVFKSIVKDDSVTIDDVNPLL